MSKNIKVNVNTEINKIAASLKTGEGGGSKTDDYNKSKNKPTINGVEIVGDLTSQELGINEITTPTCVVRQKAVDWSFGG